MAIDPICGMKVDEVTSLKAALDGKEYYFCSQRCLERFLKRDGASCVSCQPQSKRAIWRNKLFLTASVLILLIAISYFFAPLAAFRFVLFSYARKIWWAILLGLVLGGVIDYYIPREYISKFLATRKPRGIINAVLLGFLMSACSHGILALSMQLHKKGASNPAVVSFLLASPWANMTITIMLVSLFGLKGLFIILSAVAVALNTGFIYMFLERKGLIETNKNTVDVAPGFSVRQDVKKRFRAYEFSFAALKKDCKGIISGALALADMVLWWILLGMIIASLAGAFIPVAWFHKFMGPTFIGLAVTLFLATIIEVCSEGSSPLAFEIYRQTGALGNSFVFLMAGVATDYTEIGLLWTNVGRRVALWMPVVTVPQILIIGFIANKLF